MDGVGVFRVTSATIHGNRLGFICCFHATLGVQHEIDQGFAAIALLTAASAANARRSPRTVTATTRLRLPRRHADGAGSGAAGQRRLRRRQRLLRGHLGQQCRLWRGRPERRGRLLRRLGRWRGHHLGSRHHLLHVHRAQGSIDYPEAHAGRRLEVLRAARSGTQGLRRARRSTSGTSRATSPTRCRRTSASRATSATPTATASMRPTARQLHGLVGRRDLYAGATSTWRSSGSMAATSRPRRRHAGRRVQQRRRARSSGLDHVPVDGRRGVTPAPTV